jgi:hypothetical protein
MVIFIKKHCLTTTILQIDFKLYKWNDKLNAQAKVKPLTSGHI